MSLSEKIIEFDEENESYLAEECCIYKEEVKEFIKKLKERCYDCEETIDELAGEKLI